MTFPTDRRTFLRGLAAGLTGAAAGPFIRTRKARALGTGFNTEHVILVAFGGGARRSECLYHQSGLVLPHLFGAGVADEPLIDTDLFPRQVCSSLTPTASGLLAEGVLGPDLTYAEGPTNHFQGQAALLCGAYNNLPDTFASRPEAPTLFEYLRKHNGLRATDVWALPHANDAEWGLSHSTHPAYGAELGGTLISPVVSMVPVFGAVATGNWSWTDPLTWPGSLPNDPSKEDAVTRLRQRLDALGPARASGQSLLAEDERQAVTSFLRRWYADSSAAEFRLPDWPVLVDDGYGCIPSGDIHTMATVEAVLKEFRPRLIFTSHFDPDRAHIDYNRYLTGLKVADASLRVLWEHIQADPDLASRTTLIAVPEHGRDTEGNGLAPDRYGRLPVDHARSDLTNREIFLFAWGPDFKEGAVLSKSWETIDVSMTIAALLGVDSPLEETVSGMGLRAGRVMEEMLR